MKRQRLHAVCYDAATPLRWEYATDDNHWEVFTPEQNEALNQATRAQKRKECVGDYEVDLCRMSLFNNKSGEKNRVRAAVRDQESYFVWQWEGDQENNWSPYPAATCLDLQAAKNGQREPTVDLTFNRTPYKLDTARMRQINQRTKFERRIEYKLSGGF